MNHFIISAGQQINRLMASGYDLAKLPEFTTNSGWMLQYTDSDVPGKVGFVLSKGYSYALLVGVMKDNMLIDLEEESSFNEQFEYFYDQLELYIDRIVMSVLPHHPETEITREQQKLFQNSILEKAWAFAKHHLDEDSKIRIDGNNYDLEVIKKHHGNGRIAVSNRDGQYFYIQFEKHKVMSFNVKGFTREFVLKHVVGILKGYQA